MNCIKLIAFGGAHFEVTKGGPPFRIALTVMLGKQATVKLLTLT